MKRFFARCKGRALSMGRIIQKWFPFIWECMTCNRWGLFLMEGLAFAGIFCAIAVGYIALAAPILLVCAWLLEPFWAGLIGCIVAGGGVLLFALGMSGLFFFLGLRYSDSRPMMVPMNQPQPDIEKMFHDILGHVTAPVTGESPDPEQPYGREAFYSRKA
jgi:hypothetical protein